MIYRFFILLAFACVVGAVALRAEPDETGGPETQVEGGREMAAPASDAAPEILDAPQVPPAFSDAVKIGVLAFRGKELAMLRWTPTARYLTKWVGGESFEIVPLTLEEMDYAVRQKEIDFAITNSGHYITLADRYGGSRLVTLNARGPSTHQNLTGSVIFSRSDRKDISSLKDMRGKSFLSVAPQAFCFQTAWHELQGQGINPFTDFEQLRFAGFPQDSIALAVKEGAADIGNVRTGVLEAMASEGKIKLSDFRIIAPRAIRGFPFVTTSRVYPEWPFVKLKHTDKALAQKAAIALLSMPPDGDAARIGQYAGWTVPLDYSPVQDLFRTLKIGPYKGLGELTLISFFERYKMWLLMAASLLAISLLWAVRTEGVVARRTRQLAKANKALAQEVRERHNAEQLARQHQMELARVARLNTMGELASGLAHELNHPLATITNYATGCIRKLRAGKGSGKEVLEVLDKVSRQANRASKIIAGLRQSVRDEKRERTRHDLNQLIRGVAELLDFNLKKGQTRLDVQLDETLPAVIVDRIEIEQVLINLVGNAIEAMKEIPADARNVQIVTTKGDKGQVVVTVKDSGPGVSPELRAKIFHPFVSTKSDGMGLGLSISSSIIKGHGGRLWIEEADGPGTTFRFVLPTRETPVGEKIPDDRIIEEVQ